MTTYPFLKTTIEEVETEQRKVLQKIKELETELQLRIEREVLDADKAYLEELKRRYAVLVKKKNNKEIVVGS